MRRRVNTLSGLLLAVDGDDHGQDRGEDVHGRDKHFRDFYAINNDDSGGDQRDSDDDHESITSVVGAEENAIEKKGSELLMWADLHMAASLYTPAIVNIYSHIIGAAIFLFLLPLWLVTTTIPPRFAIATPADILVCGIWFFGVGVCFVLSTFFHTFMSHSHSLYHLGMKLDFQGILLLMWGGTIPLIHYSFPCPFTTTIRLIYYALTTLLALLCSLTTLHPYFSGPHVGHLRAALFSCFGFGSFLAPIAHGIAVHGLVEQSRRIGLPWILVLAALDGTGAAVYAAKFPERWFPKRFDLFGASHQVMHVMVVLAALSYTVAVLQAFDFRHRYGEVC